MFWVIGMFVVGRRQDVSPVLSLLSLRNHCFAHFPTLSCQLNPTPHPTPLLSPQPHMDGPTATRAIRRLGFRAPIFGLTGNTAEGDRTSFIQCGATQVLPKPFVYETFIAAMNRISYQ